jgi:diacylglycerol kinase (ATP)
MLYPFTSNMCGWPADNVQEAQGVLHVQRHERRIQSGAKFWLLSWHSHNLRAYYQQWLIIRTKRETNMPQEYPLLPAALIFNPGAGSADSQEDFPGMLRRLLGAVNIEATAYEAKDNDELAAATARARQQGIDLVIACGGDGTLEGVANGLVNSPITLGILPAGTRNNLAASFNIPTDLDAAASLLRSGTPRAVDVVHARCGNQERWFLELFTAGLLTDVFEDAEAVQKGNWGALGDLAAKFVGASPSTLHLTLAGEEGERQTIEAEAHAVLAMNTPYLGANFLMADDIRYDDGSLDVFLYDGLSRLDLLAHGLAIATDRSPDPRVRRLRARQLTLRSDPPVPILVDSVNMGEGTVVLQVHHAALRVITGPTREVQ